ncbi:MAG: alpha-amylase family glycosyl hydrolase [Tetrasphaera sp.]
MTRRRAYILVLVGVLVGAVVAGVVTRGKDSPPARVTSPLKLSDTEVANLARRVAPPRHENFYFVMADRFANGDPGNDRGGLSGDRTVTGFDPSDKGMYHGGDLAGLTAKLDYVKGLGTTAIWLTPSFVNQPVQGSGADVSAGYHGYWITDFTRIDPHLGTNDEMTALIDAAHARGMKVYFDIVTNHTADVIGYEGGDTAYISKETKPYVDASGTVFDDAKLAGQQSFPALTPDSFPHKPIFRSEADSKAKTPAWLNDPTLYHNRGDSTFEGESSTYGDFYGLDDLFTENPTVVDGMIEIYQKWIDFGIDGFRIDTVKHVNLQFWQRFGPALMEHAKAAGNDDFFMFGEVYDTDPAAMSQYSTVGALPATLDFGFQSAAVDFASGRPATRLQELYAADDDYLDADSNAYALPTFLGNHDLGRVASFLSPSAVDDSDLLRRIELATALMYLTRGQPVVYYGDEQGFIGAGGDKDARQDMFATKVEEYAADAIVGGDAGSRDRYDRGAPLYRHIAELAKLRADHAALRTGIQIERYAADTEGVYAFSRIDRESNVEYLVAVNNAADAQPVTVASASPGIRFDPVLGEVEATTADAQGSLGFAVPGRSAIVLRAAGPIPPAQAAPEVTALTLGTGGALSGQAKVSAQVRSSSPVEVTFALRERGHADWTVAGTDDSPAYGLYLDADRLTPGDYEIVAVARTLDGKLGYASGTARVEP